MTTNPGSTNPELSAGVPFADRADAGRQLAARLGRLRSAGVVVVGLPRGGLPVAAEVAKELRAPLDVIVVRKLGVPFQPELAMGAIGENGVRVVDSALMAEVGITAEALAAVEARERAELERCSALFRARRERVPLSGRVVVIVDDGVATGSTARAACQVARAHGAARVVLAVPVAPIGWERRFDGVADEFACVAVLRHMVAIGCAYERFEQLSDEEALAFLSSPEATPSLPTVPEVRRPEAMPSEAMPSEATLPEAMPSEARDDEVEVRAGLAVLPGRLTVPEGAAGVVLFAHGSGSSRRSPRNREVAQHLQRAGLATLLFDLLTPAEAASRANVFEVDLLAGRLTAATRWLRAEPGMRTLPVGWFGASTGAAAALWAAAEPDAPVAAVVSRGGRPDLAGQERLAQVRAPTLLVVGSRDSVVLDLNRHALAGLRCEARLVVVRGATHLFEEPGTLHAAAEEARAWFLDHLAGGVPLT